MLLALVKEMLLSRLGQFSTILLRSTPEKILLLEGKHAAGKGLKTCGTYLNIFLNILSHVTILLTPVAKRNE